MRRLLETSAAALVLSGSVLLMSAPAFAGADEAQRDSFWAKQNTGVQGSAHGHYMTMDPRDAKADPNASSGVDQADASNPYFNHAEGTMSGPDAVATTQPSNNGQYVASYHQYLSVEPRDQKVVKNPDAGQDDNIYYYHAEGTMSHP